MPLLHLHTTCSLEPEAGESLAAELSARVARHIGKPESYVMVLVAGGTAAVMGGTTGPAAWADVRSIGGLTPDVNRALTESVCGLLKERLDIPGERVYITLSDVPRTQWGWDGRTFG